MFSIIIPLYNKERYIFKAVQSVLSQSFFDYELIIVNDGSTDNSLEIVKSFKDSRIKIIEQQNQGVSTARNNGVKSSIYDFVAFLDADDWWDKRFLEEMKRLITDFPEAGIYGNRYWYVKNSQNNLTNIGLPENFETGYIDYFKTYSKTFVVPFNCSFVVVKKNAFNETGRFNSNLKFGEDFDLWVRMALKYKVAYLNRPLAYSNQDIPSELRALGFEKLYPKEHHCIFNFGYLIEEEVRNTDLKKLIDGLKARSLVKYHLQGKYTRELNDLLKDVDFKSQPFFYSFIYKYPKPIVKFFYFMRKIGSKTKQGLIKKRSFFYKRNKMYNLIFIILV